MISTLCGRPMPGIVSDQRLEERPGPARRVEHDGAGDLDLAHRQFPPVPGPLVVRAERQRQPVQPPLGEHRDGARLRPVADLLQRGRVVAGREPVGQLPVAEPGAGGLPLGPLMAVDPDLGRVGEVGADLDERRPEALIPQVEVVAGHPPVSLGEGELRRRGAGFPPVSGPDPLELLRHPDRRHPRAVGRGLPVQVRAHHVRLAVLLREPDPRDVVSVGERGHRTAEPLPHLVEDRRRGNRQAQVLRHERHDLPAGLQDRHVSIQVDPVQALDIQRRMPIEHLPRRHYTCAHDTLRDHAYEREDEPRRAF